MITIEVAAPYAGKINPEALEHAAFSALNNQSAPSSYGLTIVVTGNEQLQELNNSYRGINIPTDVLAFPSRFTDPDNDVTYLGDVVLSYPQAKNQAEAAGHTVTAELQLLVVHGILHLLGRDHAEAGEKAMMWAAQKEILIELGIPFVNPPLE